MLLVYIFPARTTSTRTGISALGKPAPTQFAHAQQKQCHQQRSEILLTWLRQSQGNDQTITQTLDRTAQRHFLERRLFL